MHPFFLLLRRRYLQSPAVTEQKDGNGLKLEKLLNKYSLLSPLHFINILSLFCTTIKPKLFAIFIQDIWTTQPIAALLMFGFPLLVFSFLIYMLCIVDSGPEEEDLVDDEEEAEIIIDEDLEEKEVKESDDEADPGAKPKLD